MKKELAESFRTLYGEEPRVFRAPGRVNLIGEHTDYNDGFVMPAALDFATWIAATPRDDDTLLIRSLNLAEEVQFRLDDTSHSGGHHWSDYVRGVAMAARSRQLPVRGATLLVKGNVPIGAGLSSSASIEVATALALFALAGVEVAKPEIALLCQQAENEFVGMRCGIMDQFISVAGQEQHALFLDCRSLETRLLPLSAETRLVICNSMVKHELAGGEYNERRAACEEGSRKLGVKALRDASLEQVETLPQGLRQRCRHVVSENLRVEQAAAALQAGKMARFGELMLQSHRSLRDDYEVSCAELDQLVELATPLPGVYGARMTGGGFGGCTINLVKAEAVDEFRTSILAGYPKAEIYVCSAAAGASEI